MSDTLERKARFRLKRDAMNWTLEKSYFSKKEAADRWRPDSYHPRLGSALRYLLDRLMAEGYETKGVSAMIERLAQAEVRVTELGERIESGEDKPEVEAL